MLNSPLPGGIAYVETKSLDGETNLKHKVSIKEITAMCRNDKEALKLDAHIECESPNDRIYKFEGIFKGGQLASQTLSLSSDNLLLRGSSLRNTEYAYAVVVFVGHDTKIMLNSTASRSKTSRNERMTNI